MKKGLTLVETMVIVCILGILLAVLVPKLGGHFRKHSCEEDLDRCKVEAPEVYYDLCDGIKNINECKGFCSEFISEENLKHCFGDDINMKELSSNTGKPVKVVYAHGKIQNNDVKVIHDTVYVHDTIYVDKSYDSCVKNCKENNKSQSVIDFCIKEECK